MAAKKPHPYYFVAYRAHRLKVLEVITDFIKRLIRGRESNYSNCSRGYEVQH